MWSILTWAAILGLVAAVGFFVLVMVRAYVAGTTPSAILFKPRPEPRVDVVEQTRLDSRRQLVLIRRDDVEHLIMTGGPVDMVIETGIGEKKRGLRGLEPPAVPAPAYQPAAATVLTRPARNLSQASGSTTGGGGGGAGEGT